MNLQEISLKTHCEEEKKNFDPKNRPIEYLEYQAIHFKNNLYAKYLDFDGKYYFKSQLFSVEKLQVFMQSNFEEIKEKAIEKFPLENFGYRLYFEIKQNVIPFELKLYLFLGSR